MQKISTVGQHCCSLHGMIRCMSNFDGDIAVILHSDTNCSNLICKKELAQETISKYFCTNLTNNDIVTGNSIFKLEKCIREISVKIKPKAIIVLESCISNIIHDDVKGLLTRLQNNKNIKPVYRYNTNGLKFENPMSVIDEAASLFFEIFSKDPHKKENKSINILGFDLYKNKDAPETYNHTGYKTFISELEKARIYTNSMIEPGCSIKEYEKAGNASLNVTFDKRIYKKLSSKFWHKYKIKTIEVPFPVGLKSSLKFIEQITHELELDYEKAISNLNNDIARAQQLIYQTKSTLRNKKLIYNISSSLNFSVHNSAKEGLLMLDFFKELGMDVEIFLQGKPESYQEYRNLLEELEIKEKLIIFGHCGDAYKHFPDEVCMVYGSPLLKEQAEEAGYIFFDYDSFLPGLKNMESNIQRLVENVN